MRWEFNVVVDDDYAYLEVTQFGDSDEDPLDGAIDKWETMYAWMVRHGITTDGPRDGGRFTCPLCLMYDKCVGCDIAEDGHPDCRNTPYYQYADTRKRRYIRAEIRYLRGLKRRKNLRKTIEKIRNVLGGSNHVD